VLILQALEVVLIVRKKERKIAYCDCVLIVVVVVAARPMQLSADSHRGAF
jgi:hypothetical protein